MGAFPTFAASMANDISLTKCQRVRIDWAHRKIGIYPVAKLGLIGNRHCPPHARRLNTHDPEIQQLLQYSWVGGRVSDRPLFNQRYQPIWTFHLALSHLVWG